MADASSSLVPADAVAIPGHHSTDTATAGVTAVPMDEDTMQQPVVAYFQFIQQNVRRTSRKSLRSASKRRRRIEVSKAPKQPPLQQHPELPQ